MINPKIIEYGIDHKDDKLLYRTITFNQKVTASDGTVDVISLSKTYSRDRVIQSIPDGGNKQIKYTDWKLVK
ncbi:MAG: hypothetical protein LKH59_06585 [Lactobacillus crispatus]|uniref:hypothetical protein n=1 Tax=Lactobacillus crispatus TaxID=47770 RepID=UPI0018AB423D|nr:hypothetical protein [Lactobacillus crispatus]MCH4003646.1 hypothetical protein [Lactobacillus crispatus]MCI1336332.1 hypothetical protein [Lactobacillus crispatus]MCI1365838.1 hypothetical protein [Lactobacillus crispatus]MCI1494191.1 hypothetical protein [Lactobacillus crispatus]MCI1524245.1 hypothetical protein [Lactobacillus crispatus]